MRFSYPPLEVQKSLRVDSELVELEADASAEKATDSKILGQVNQVS